MEQLRGEIQQILDEDTDRRQKERENEKREQGLLDDIQPAYARRKHRQGGSSRSRRTINVKGGKGKGKGKGNRRGSRK